MTTTALGFLGIALMLIGGILSKPFFWVKKSNNLIILLRPFLGLFMLICGFIVFGWRLILIFC